MHYFNIDNISINNLGMLLGEIRVDRLGVHDFPPKTLGSNYIFKSTYNIIILFVTI